MQVLVLCGSKSDIQTMRAGTEILKEFEVSYALHVASAHRTPERVLELVETAESEGCKVIIAGAGFAAHLPGAVASRTTLPVIGVPIDCGPFQGNDALLSTVQMPPGIPVATVSVGKAGAINSALLAVEMMALSDEELKSRLKKWRRKRAEQVIESDPAGRT